MRTSVSRRVARVSQATTARLSNLAASLKLFGTDVVDLSAETSPDATPTHISAAAARALADGATHQTPARGNHEMLQAAGAKLKRDHGLDIEWDTSILATMGCRQGLLLALLATLNHGDEVIVEDPCFLSYDPTIRFAGGQPVRVALRNENHFRWAKADLESAITRHTRAILLCAPHNPTGTVPSEADLDIIAAVAEKYDLIVIVDEASEQLTWGGRKHACLAKRPGMWKRTITLRSLSNGYAMSGWRIGYAFGPEDYINAMETVQQHLVASPSALAQTSAAVALSAKPSDTLRGMWADWERRCQFAAAEINTMEQASCVSPEGGFYAWVDIKRTGRTSKDLANELLKEYHVSVVPGSAFGPHGEGYIRLTCVRSWKELRTGLKRLRKAFR
jgi:aspartate/methionine/tyrosine aminotransferase